jgi:hypothetical protein
MIKRSKRPTALVAALIVIVAAIAVTAAMASSNDPATKAITAVPKARVSTRLEHLFGVLQTSARTHGASAAAAQPLPAAIKEGVSQEVTLDLSAVVFAGGAYPTWVIPGSTEICLMANATKPGGSPGGICGSIAAVEQRGIAETTEGASGSPVVLGLVPNGNTSVEVTNANGTKETVPVTNNVYEITSGDPVSATLKNASGATTTRHLPVLSTPPPPSTPHGG